MKVECFCIIGGVFFQIDFFKHSFGIRIVSNYACLIVSGIRQSNFMLKIDRISHLKW